MCVVVVSYFLSVSNFYLDSIVVVVVNKYEL